MNTRAAAAEYRMTQWAQAMRERTDSGESITEFCQRKGVSRNTYFYWQRKLRKATCEQIVKQEEKSLTPLGFTEVKMCGETTGKQASERVDSQLHIEILGVQITTDSAYPTDKLAALLRELTQLC
jgi:putative transposase